MPPETLTGRDIVDAVARINALRNQQRQDPEIETRLAGYEMAFRMHATMLHLLGIDHQRLTYKVQGLDFRLTGAEPARVVQGLLG